MVKTGFKALRRIVFASHTLLKVEFQYIQNVHASKRRLKGALSIAFIIFNNRNEIKTNNSLCDYNICFDACN